MPDSPRETHRSFTVRVPMSVYLKITERANSQDMNINQTVNDLLHLGLGEGIKLDKAIVAMVRRLEEEV